MRFSRSLISFSALTLAVSALSGCAYIIPPEQNVPRNNTVQGDVRKPQLNVNMMGRSGTAVVRRPSMAEPVMRAATSNLPPVDAQTQEMAEQRMAPEPMAAKPANPERRVPAQNAKFQMSSNSYPPIDSVPPRPAMSGPDSAQSRLSATQADLEKSRDIAVESKATLAKDAAAEPSMLSELPKTDGVVPANDPVVIAPAVSQPVPAPEQVRPAPATGAAITPTVAPQPVAVAAPRVQVATAPLPSRLPALPVFAPPTPSGNVASISAPAAATSIKASVPPAQVSAAVAPVVVPEKIRLVTQPVEIVETPAPAPQPAMAATAPTVKKGDFDPLAVADNAPIATTTTSATRNVASSAYVSNRYIAPSRYSDRRY
jgi:hypothetical protein